MGTTLKRAQENGQVTLQKKDWRPPEWESKYLTVSEVTPGIRLQALEIFAKCGRMQDVVEKLGINRSSIRSLLSSDPDFALAWGEAYDAYRDYVEGRLEDRALNGTEEPVIGGKDRDKIVATIQRYETQLTLAFAKRHIPEYVESRQIGGVNIEAGVLVVGSNVQATGKEINNLSPENWKKAFDTGGKYVAGELPLNPPPALDLDHQDLIDVEEQETLEEKVARLEAEIAKRARLDDRNSRRGSRKGEYARRIAKKKAQDDQG